MYPSFVDNFMHPITLPANVPQVEVELPLPDGNYMLTVADSESDATRHELVRAMVMDGTAQIMRMPSDSLPEYPVGSVIYCAMNAEVLRLIFSELEYLYWDIEAIRYKGTYGFSANNSAPLEADRGQINGYVSGGVARLDVDEYMPAMTVAEHIIIAEIYPSGTLRLHGNGRPVVEARMQNHPNLTFTMGPAGEYVDINVSSFFRCMIRLQTEVREYDEEACAFIATFHDLDTDFALLSSPPPNHN